MLELLVVLALLGILLALAAPGVAGLRQQHQLQSQAEHLLGSLLWARSQALMRQQRVTVCLRQTDEACAPHGSWAQGWLVFVDDNDNAQREAQEPVLQVHAPAPAGVRMQGNTTVNRYVSYGALGRSQSVSGAFQAGTITMCRAAQSPVWRLVINAVGKPRLASSVRTAEAEC